MCAVDKMLLNNNNESGQAGSVAFRQSRPSKPSRSNNNNVRNKDVGSGGGASGARNSWSFQAVEQQQQQVSTPKAVENIYADPELLMMNGNEMQHKSVSRSRLRQRSVSNLNASALAGTRSRDHRDHSSSNNRNGGGTISAKGVDYIRLRPTMLLEPQQQQQQQIQDRSEYGNPDGSSAHSTAEREAGLANNKETSTNHHEVYQVMHQNHSNHLIQHGAEAAAGPGGEQLIHPVPLARLGSGRGSAVPPHQQQPTRGSPRPSEVVVVPPAVAAATAAVAPVHPTRKLASATVSSGPVKTCNEWTFLPSPTAPPTVQSLNSPTVKPEVVMTTLIHTLVYFSLSPCL